MQIQEKNFLHDTPSVKEIHTSVSSESIPLQPLAQLASKSAGDFKFCKRKGDFEKNGPKKWARQI